MATSRLVAGTSRRGASRETRTRREEPKTCGDCSHLLEGCCDYGICEFEFEEAFDEEAGKRPLPAWEAARWARDWIVEHYKDMQEDTCERCDG